MDLETALNWASSRRNGVLITLRRDGRPQSSDVAYALADGVFTISVTNDRAKTANMRRDPRVVLHLSEPSSHAYLAFDGRVEISPVAADPADATSDALVTYFERVTGAAHPNWQQFRAAMVAEGRVVVRFTPTSVVGQGV